MRITPHYLERKDNYFLIQQIFIISFEIKIHFQFQMPN